MWKTIHVVCGAGIQTHNLLIDSLHPYPLDQDFFIKYYAEENLDFSGIRTQIVKEEGELTGPKPRSNLFHPSVPTTMLFWKVKRFQPPLSLNKTF